MTAYYGPLQVLTNQAIAGGNYPSNRSVWHGLSEITFDTGGFSDSVWYKDNGPHGLDTALLEPRAFCTRGEARFSFTGQTLIVRLNVAWSWWDEASVTIDGSAPSTLDLISYSDILNCDASVYLLPSGGYVDVMVADGLTDTLHEAIITIDSPSTARFFSMAGFKVGSLSNLPLTRTGGWLVPTEALLTQNITTLTAINRGDRYVFNATLSLPETLVDADGNPRSEINYRSLAPAHQHTGYPNGESIVQSVLPVFSGDEESGTFPYELTLTAEYDDPEGSIARTVTDRIAVGSPRLTIDPFFVPLIGETEGWFPFDLSEPVRGNPVRAYTTTFGDYLSFAFTGDVLTLSFETGETYDDIAIYDDDNTTLLNTVACSGSRNIITEDVAGFGVGDHTVFLRKATNNAGRISVIAASPLARVAYDAQADDYSTLRQNTGGNFSNTIWDVDSGVTDIRTYRETDDFGSGTAMQITFTGDVLTVTVQTHGFYPSPPTTGAVGIYASNNSTLLHTIPGTPRRARLFDIQEHSFSGFGGGDHTIYLRKTTNDGKPIRLVSVSPVPRTPFTAEANDIAFAGVAGIWNVDTSTTTSEHRAFTSNFANTATFQFVGDTFDLKVQRNFGWGEIGLYAPDHLTTVLLGGTAKVSCDNASLDLHSVTFSGFGGGTHTVVLKKTTNDSKTIVFVTATQVVRSSAAAMGEAVYTVTGGGNWGSATALPRMRAFTQDPAERITFDFDGDDVPITVQRSTGFGDLGVYDASDDTLLGTVSCDGDGLLTQTIATGLGAGVHTAYLARNDALVGSGHFVVLLTVGNALDPPEAKADDFDLTYNGDWTSEACMETVSYLFTNNIRDIALRLTFVGDSFEYEYRGQTNTSWMGVYAEDNASELATLNTYASNGRYWHTFDGFGPGEHSICIRKRTDEDPDNDYVYFATASWPEDRLFTEQTETITLNYLAQQPVAMPVENVVVGDYDLTFGAPDIDDSDFSETPVRENTDLVYTEVMSRFPTFAVCYQGGFRDILAQYDILIVDPLAARTSDVIFWRNKGIKVFGYIASGEEVGFYSNRYDFASALDANKDGSGPGGYCEYYMFTKYPDTGPPDKNGVWASYYTNPDTDFGWPQRVDNYYAPLLFDGPLVVEDEVVTITTAEIGDPPQTVLVFDTAHSPIDGDEPIVVVTDNFDGHTLITYQEYTFDVKTGAFVITGAPWGVADGQELKISYTRKGHHMDGVFWDVVDTPDVYLSHTFEFGYAFVEGYDTKFIDFLNNFKLSHPDKMMISNRGFTILPHIIHSCAGVMFESWLTHPIDITHLSTTDYARIDGDLDYNEGVNTELFELRKNHTFDVYSLNYCLPGTPGNELRNYCRVEDAKRGYLSWQSTITLDVPAPNDSNVSGGSTTNTTPGLPNNSFVRFKTKRIVDD